MKNKYISGGLIVKSPLFFYFKINLEVVKMYNYNPFNTQRIDKQIDELNAMKQQLMQQQAPVQNIINTGYKADLEARMLGAGEDVNNIIVQNRTVFIDEVGKKVSIKELDGTISKSYDIVVPKDPKDVKIEELENKIKEMELRFNEYSKSIRTNNDEQQPNAVNNGNVESTTKKSSKSTT